MRRTWSGCSWRPSRARRRGRPSGGAGAAGLDAAPPAAFRAFHRERFAGLDGRHRELTFAVLMDGRTVGVARLARVEAPNALEAGLWLTREARGRGVGGEVLRLLLAEAAGAGASLLLAETTRDNIAALPAARRRCQRGCAGRRGPRARRTPARAVSRSVWVDALRGEAVVGEDLIEVVDEPVQDGGERVTPGGRGPRGAGCGAHDLQPFTEIGRCAGTGALDPGHQALLAGVRDTVGGEQHVDVADQQRCGAVEHRGCVRTRQRAVDLLREAGAGVAQDRVVARDDRPAQRLRVGLLGADAARCTSRCAHRGAVSCGGCATTRSGSRPRPRAGPGRGRAGPRTTRTSST